MRCAAFTYSRRPATRQQARDAAKSKDQSPAMLPSNPPPLIPSTATKTSTRSATEKGHENRPVSLPTRGAASLRGQTVAGLRSQVVAGSKGQSVARGQAVSGPRPSKVPVSRPHGGRHLQPPSGDNAKLKHKCPFEGCSWRFATPYKLRRHIKSHTKETPFQCTECGRGFSVRYNLLMHIQTIHSVPQKFHCPMKGCKEAFHTQPRLNGHLRRVHKKDWKQLHLSQSDTDSQAGSPCSTESLESTNTKPSPTGDGEHWFSCGVCRRDFSSQAKLSAHMRVHSSRDKINKCSVEGCFKTFTSSDKLTRHMLTHKSSQQYRCSHDNCRRVFTRQSHLKNHLKIHSSDEYVCPVTDCGEKLSSQAQYNDHFNTHMRCQLACPHPDCQLTFPSQKRLELHTHVAHNMDHTTGIKLSSSPSPSAATGAFLPHSPTPSHDQLPAVSKHSGLHYPTMGHNETLENLELPDLKVEDIQAVISDHSDWSGEQVENFFNSLDLSRPDCPPQSLGGSGYDSDSGYSTYDVSPIGSTIGAHYNSSLSPAITPVTPTPILSSSSPLPITSSYHDEFMQGQGMLATPIAVTPQSASDGYFDLSSLPPHSEPFTDQVFAPHYPALYHESVPMPSSSLSFAMNYQQNSAYSFSSDVVPQCTPPATTSSMDDDKHTIMFIPNTYGHIPQSVGPSPLVLEPVPQVKQNVPVSVGSEPLHHPSSPPLSCPLPTTSTSAFMALNEDERQLSLPDLKERAASSNDTSCHPPHLMKTRCLSDRTVYAQVLPPTTAPLSQCKERSNLRPVKSRQGRSGSVPMKRSKRAKSQWPKSMNPGNLMAFRNFILNKLKAGQEKPLTVSGPPQPLYSESTNSETSSGQNSPTTVQSYDFLSDMTFNPDTLLSSDLPSSPFDLLSPSATPDDTFSVSSPESQLLGSDIGVDFDGYAQLFSADDLPLTEALSDSNISSDLENIFIKTDRDPLLGGAHS